MQDEMQGIQVEFSSGLVASMIPLGEGATFVVGDMEFTANPGASGVQITIVHKRRGEAFPVGIKTVAWATFERPRDIEVVASQPVDLSSGSTRQACSTCNGHSYCVTNGCLNIGCGWICDR